MSEARPAACDAAPGQRFPAARSVAAVAFGFPMRERDSSSS